MTEAKGYRVVCHHCDHRKEFPTHAEALKGLDAHVAQKCAEGKGGGHVEPIE